LLGQLLADHGVLVDGERVGPRLDRVRVGQPLGAQCVRLGDADDRRACARASPALRVDSASAIASTEICWAFASASARILVALASAASWTWRASASAELIAASRSARASVAFS